MRKTLMSNNNNNNNNNNDADVSNSKGVNNNNKRLKPNYILEISTKGWMPGLSFL